MRQPSRHTRTFFLSILAGLTAAAAIAVGSAPTSTPASGPSLLSKWGREMRTSALGRLGQEGAGESLEGEIREPGRWIREGFEIDGEALFRFNCRSCHGGGGQGLLPEIRPLTEVSNEDVLRHRIDEGGAVMPAFGHFSPEEADLLIAYLDVLAGRADPARESLEIPVDRVGEHVIKGSCQVCHDATEKSFLRPIADQDIPPLASFIRTQSLLDFVTGARHLVVEDGEVRQGRGPRYRFLRDDELEAAYLYLAVHPPE